MKQTFIHRTLASALVAISALTSGCASLAVSNDSLEQNTASSLGLPKSAFTISDRVDNGVKSTYTVKTNSGKQYSCYVTGTFSILGPVVSDAICNGIRKPVKQTTGTSDRSCNALLKAAGKC
ncbi:hypothetical protein QN379_17930 [Glaciimonas sp. Gout2]|uniref:hypothetical protein n=1 Tax=unclassified Glaciimonas TaxID=2644401 RepID=UPI002B2389BD|nr:MULTISPECIES: hypothetical protein [unclassified Glaciimonas]MEB0012136.1 hypothetical protein [Glaciimonas sp. Cout2]MEB0083891.1 hypothetical protein [Glaciimonas sp. Gout2]